MQARRTSGQSTSLDVAALAGVSQPTVSRALRDDPRIAVATRDRVHRAAESLNYVPSQRGRALSTRTTGRIGVVVGDLGNPFYLQLLELLHAALASASLQMVVFTDGDNELEVGQLLDGSIDGVVLTTTVSGSPLVDQLRRRELPIVLLNRHTDDAETDICAADNAGGATLVANEFAGLGHTRIGAIFGPQNTSTGRERQSGFRHALAARDLTLRDELVREGEFSFDAGHRALASLMQKPDPPTAIFCSNDVIALGAINAARALGVSIPEQLSLIGFDDISMAGWEVFALTTVGQNMDGLATQAIEQLRLRVETPARPVSRITVETELVRRGTHGPPQA